MVNAKEEEEKQEEDKFEPVESSKIKSKTELTDVEKSIMELQGKALIRNGQVGVVILAGGQGSRLGLDGPKGKFSIGLPSDKTLFQLLTERFFKAQMMAHGVEAEDVGTDAEGKSVPKIPSEV